MSEMIKGLMPNIRGLLPADIAYEQFRAALWLEITGRQALYRCSQQSLRAAMVKAATMGVLPGRDCHLLPFKGDAQCITNYQGLVLILERTGKVAKAFAHPVYEGDEIVLDYFANQYKHIPYMVRGKEPGKILFYYGAIMMKQGPPHVEAMSLDQIDRVRRKAPAHESGPWVTDTIEMSRKTALRRVMKFVRLTEQQEQLLEEEDAIAATDIPEERHRKNIADLFGDTVIDVTPPARPAPPSLWRETLEAHWQSVPEPLKEQCRAALEDAETPESHGLALASAVLDWLDSAAPEPGSAG
jgi:recombination protein RecT